MRSYKSLFGLKPGEEFPKSPWSRKYDDRPAYKAMADRVAFFLNETDGEITRPKQFGSPQAPLGKKLVEDPGHRKLLNDDEMELMMTWLDIRAPYWDQYYQRNKTVVVKPYDPWGDSREHEFEFKGK
jgi:hypothetical protein